MAKKVNPVPEGYRTITPSLTVRDAARAIEFYKKAFGASEVSRFMSPDGKSVMHAEIRIGDSILFLMDEGPGSDGRAPETLGGTTGGLHLYVKDADAAVKKAVDAGARVTMPAADMFWGDRYGKVVDPFGYPWGLATRKENLTEAEMRKRAESFFREQSRKAG